MSRLRRTAFPLAIVVLVSGCMTAARAFLDLPEESRGAREQEAREAVSMEMLDSIIRALQAPPELPPPPIEAVTSSDSILSLLPRDRAGEVDWVSARSAGTIRPRASRPGVPPDSTQIFPFDIYLERSGGPRAYFPHSVHQAWLACQSCHPGVYGADVGVAPAEVTHGDQSCGMCHNGIAFQIESCERCHDAAGDLPSQRISPTLGGEIVMSRAPSSLPENSDGSAYTTGGDYYEPAVFPHGAHRLRFQCKACHEQPFPMVAGGSQMTEDQAHNQSGCGACHNGRVAFDTSLNDCHRCHKEVGARQSGT